MKKQEKMIDLENPDTLDKLSRVSKDIQDSISILKSLNSNGHLVIEINPLIPKPEEDDSNYDEYGNYIGPDEDGDKEYSTNYDYFGNYIDPEDNNGFSNGFSIHITNPVLRNELREDLEKLLKNIISNYIKQLNND